MHVDDLTISSTSTDCSCNNDQRISVHEIPYASLILGTVAGVCNKIEFEGVREGKDNKEDQEEFDD
jgi:hypothetical protein